MATMQRITRPEEDQFDFLWVADADQKKGKSRSTNKRGFLKRFSSSRNFEEGTKSRGFKSKANSRALPALRSQCSDWSASTSSSSSSQKTQKFSHLSRDGTLRTRKSIPKSATRPPLTSAPTLLSKDVLQVFEELKEGRDVLSDALQYPTALKSSLDLPEESVVLEEPSFERTTSLPVWLEPTTQKRGSTQGRSLSKDAKLPPRKLPRDESFSKKALYCHHFDSDNSDEDLELPRETVHKTVPVAPAGLKPPPASAKMAPQPAPQLTPPPPPPKVKTTTKKVTHLDPTTGEVVVTTTTTTTTTTSTTEPTLSRQVAPPSTSTSPPPPPQALMDLEATLGAARDVPGTVELSPGLVVALRGVKETLTYLREKPDCIGTTSCLACQTEVRVLSDAAMFLCPVCRLVLPLAGDCGEGNGVALGFVQEAWDELQAAALAFSR